MSTLTDKVFMKSIYKQNLRAKWWWQVGEMQQKCYCCHIHVVRVYTTCTLVFFKLYFLKKELS